MYIKPYIKALKVSLSACSNCWFMALIYFEFFDLTKKKGSPLKHLTWNYLRSHGNFFAMGSWYRENSIENCF